MRLFNPAFLVIALLVALVAAAFAADGDTIYNSRGQGIQVYAPNVFHAMSSAAKRTFNLSKTKIFQMDSTTDCIVYLTPTASTSGVVSRRVLADTPKTEGRGHKIGFATYSGCYPAVFSEMQSDWTGD